MNIEEFATKFGLPGLLVLVWYLLERSRIERNAKTEDKKTEAMTVGFQSLSGKFDAHHTADIQSHQAIATSIATLSGQVSEAINWQERTPIGAPPQPDPRRTPAGVYSIGRKNGEKP